MGEDNFSGLVRSGKSHSVSVSERTGNAKTVRNNVSSDEQEIDARKTAFEKQSPEEKTNIQKANSDSTQSKRQSLSIDKSNSNRQQVNQDSGVEPHVRGVNTEGFKDNNQKVDLSTTAVNLQKVANANATANNQGVVKNKAIQDKNQKIPNGGVSNNNQAVNGGALKPNVQGIPIDGLVTNQQAIDQTSLSPNNQSLPKDQVAPNKQAAQSVVNNNRQPLENIDPGLNMHRAPRESGMGINRQPTDKENLDDHFEVLPSETVERAEVDFGLSGSDGGSESLNTFPKIRVKKTENAPAIERSLTAQQAAKLKHDKFVEAFHGRLAGIKRGVDELNGRLDVMEKRK
jgi:hypothetical protein